MKLRGTAPAVVPLLPLAAKARSTGPSAAGRERSVSSDRKDRDRTGDIAGSLVVVSLTAAS